KLKLWKQHLLQNNVSHFPRLDKKSVTTPQKYASYIKILIDEFQSRLKTFKAEKTAVYMNFFFSPFSIDVSTVPENFQMEVIDMKNNSDLKNEFFLVKHQKFL